MNGDGRMDLLSGSYAPGDIYWFFGKPAGFAAGRVLSEEPSPGIERSASAASAVDWDGDGDLDLLIGNIAGDVFWTANVGTKREPRFGRRQAVPAGSGPLAFRGGDAHPVAVDWDGDGVQDLLVGTGDGGVYCCRGTRSSSAVPVTLSAPVRMRAAGRSIALGYRAKIAVADWNNDGRLDLLVGDAEDTKNYQTNGYVYVALRTR